LRSKGDAEEAVEMTEERIAEYVRDNAPELDPKDVSEFLAEHAKPEDEPSSHIEWAVRVLRQRVENEHGDGLSVDRVADELRRQDR
jgi:hypothetical protein